MNPYCQRQVSFMTGSYVHKTFNMFGFFPLSLILVVVSCNDRSNLHCRLSFVKFILSNVLWDLLEYSLEFSVSFKGHWAGIVAVSNNLGLLGM